MSSSLHIGEIYQVRVERVLPIGLRVQLGSRTDGLIRTRELRWEDIGAPDWKQHYTVNGQYSAKLIGWEGDRPLLSLRFAQRDPWETVAIRYRLGKIHTGIVSGFSGPTAYIDLEPGVTATLQRSELPAWNNRPIEEFLWLGDQVRVLPLTVNAARREMSVTMQGLEKVRWPTDILENTTEIASSPRREFAAPPLPATTLYGAAPRSILVLEDDPRQNDSICGLLRMAGHHVEGVIGESLAVAALERRFFEVILSDVGLKEGDGLHFVRQMQPRFPECRWIVMTDWASAEQRDQEIRPLEQAGVLLLLKPALPEEIEILLQTPVMEKATSLLLTSENEPTVAAFAAKRNSARLRSATKAGTSAKEILDQLCRSSRASRAILFCLHAYQRQIDIVAESGQGPIHLAGLGQLLYSPVREVLEEQATVQVSDVDEATGYVRNLTPLLRFRSCIGVPVPTATEEKYALFLFHTQASFVSDVIVQDAGNAALALGARLEQQSALSQIGEIQRASLSGHLARGMIHEVNHHLGPMAWLLPKVQRTTADLLSAVEKLQTATGGNGIGIREAVVGMGFDLQNLQDEVKALDSSVKSLSQTARLFGRITVQDEEQILRVERVVEHCFEIIRDLADRSHVHLHLRVGESPHLTRARESQLLQILLNLMVNAVQQIARSRPAGGHLAVEVGDGEVNGRKSIRICVEDDGPGIHHRLWRPIFRLGMTTRQGEGSGLGLFIAERLVEDLGGTVEVEESFMGWGSRFVVELPVQA
jgi:signal transduction histidine kinase/DNA-binding response OmpR family regulator/predicted RNA-binding protein with RPS1 domain